MSDRPRLSDEELCARIRGYWLGVRGGETVEVRVGDGTPVELPDGRTFATRAIVSNLVGGKPPGVRAGDLVGGKPPEVSARDMPKRGR